MGFYQDRILPSLIHLAMRNRNLAPYRKRVVSEAAGRVLEIGVGSGLNLPFYGESASHVIGLDPSPRLLAMARAAARRTAMPLELIEGSAEAIPIEDRSVDTVMTTWTLCSIPEVGCALHEMRRVLRRSGRLLFVEHGRAPEAGVRWWQDRLTPMWKHLAGGCHLNRAIDQLIEDAGFRIERLDRGYMRGPKPMTFMYEGAARPR
jgi:ubiquinone/menaquinone biosynthesis C-methylase UbiE